jgi:dihydrofolate reductase
MHISLADVISLNGKITRGSDPNIHAWSSQEDWKHFVQLKDENQVIIIDRKTYETVQPAAEKDKLRIVFTSTPERFKAASLPGQLEFVNEMPSALVQRLQAAGYTKVLIAGGARLSSSFLAAQLIDDIYISFEPVLFGTGRSMLNETPLNIPLQLKSVNRLNDQGTLLAHYTVIKTHS